MSIRPVWAPHVTVASVVGQNGLYLMVEEETEQGVRLNQPAGHLEANESLVDACVRETLEETAYKLHPEAVLGVYRWDGSGTAYLRFAFIGHVVGPVPGRQLDRGILRALWLSHAELQSSVHLHRSPLVLRCVEDHLAGKRVPLDFLVHYD